jgi:hypothetical protein
MKKISLAIFLSLLLHLQINAQGSRGCNTMQNLERLKTIDPSIVDNMNAIETFTDEYRATHPFGGERAVITIPVVVHVVYNNSTQNISDAQIASQITILNNDFRKLNADRTSVPAVFSSLASDCEISFCMAQRTPAGLATNGIDRVSTATTSFIDNDRVKSSSTGGANVWDATKYLNIWVCNLGSGLLGYAQFPGGSSSTDGVVIAYTAFGNIGTAASPYNLGRTATHEVGHWLNLRHIWGDASCGSDLVTDTPTQSTSNFGCPAFPHVTCSNGPNGDMWMNYMDYTDDRCMYMFTTGQKTRAQSLFATGGSRVSLVSSNGCTPPAVVAPCATPSGLAAGSITSSGATLSWTAVSGATSYNIQYKLSAALSWTTTTSTTPSKVLTSLAASSSYIYQIQTVCSSSSSSAYSASATFTTSAAVSSCGVDSYEPNNSLGTYRAISTNTNYLAYICPTGDEDWYRFTTTSAARNFRIDLTTLPLDYDLYVYSSSGTLLGSSTRSGTTSERYTRNRGTVGNYYIRVIGYSGATSPSLRYTLRATTSSSSLRTSETETDGDIIDIVDENTGFIVYPNPANDHFVVSYNSDVDAVAMVSIYNAMGGLLSHAPFSVSPGLNQVEINTNDLVNGYYFVVLQDGNSKYSTKLFISKQ